MGWFSRLFVHGLAPGGKGSRATGGAREESLWDGSVVANIPSYLIGSMEEDGTYVLSPNGVVDAAVIVRLSLLSFRTPDSRPFAGLEQVRSDAKKNCRPFREIEGKGITTYTEPATEAGKALDVHYWIVGAHDNIAIVSATVLRSRAAEPEISQTLKDVSTLVDHLRFAQRYEFVETAQGTIQNRVTEAPKVPPVSRLPFDEKERAWLQRTIATAQAVIGQLVPDAVDTFDARVLDVAFARWLATSPAGASGSDVDSLIEAFGAAFGEHLVREYGMSWFVITDEYGAAKALCHPRGTTTAFPVESVRKRVEDRTTNFFWSISQTVKNQIEGLND